MSRTWIHHPKLKQRIRVHLSAKDDVWSRKFRLFVEKILELDGPISIRRAAKEADVHRETARKYLAIMENNGLLMSTTAGLPPKKVYFSEGSPLLEDHDLREFYDKLKSIRDRWFRDPPPIETVFSNKARGFNDWGPDSRKVIDDLENELWNGLGVGVDFAARSLFIGE